MRARNAARKADLARALVSPGFMPAGAGCAARNPPAAPAAQMPNHQRPALRSATSSPTKVTSVASHWGTSCRSPSVFQQQAMLEALYAPSLLPCSCRNKYKQTI
jgi:hypothetical protein